MIGNYLLISLGGAIGTFARYFFSGVIADRFGETFPFGTLLVNVTGSLAIGFFATLTDVDGGWLVRPAARQFFMMGICGGYTTFSSFSLQTMNLAREGEWARAGANIVVSVALCLAAVWVGHILALFFNHLKGRI